MNSRVNIISINYNSAEDMLHCIASLQNASYPNYQLFIVDNQSTDDSVKVIIEECKAKGISIIETTPNELQNGYDSLDTNAIYLIKNNENKGFAAGNNTGLKFFHNFWMATLSANSGVLRHSIMPFSWKVL